MLASYTYGHDLLSQKRGLENRYFHYDRLGSTKGLTDENQTVTDAYNYEAFGNLLQVAGTTPNHYRFTGEQHEPQTGLIYLRARYYDPATGRFITQDTWQGQRGKPITLHKYLYANGNPVVFIDPTGYMSIGSLMAGVQIRSILTRIWTTFRASFRKWLKIKKHELFKGTSPMPGLDAKEYPGAHHFVYVQERGKRRGTRFDFAAPNVGSPGQSRRQFFGEMLAIKKCYETGNPKYLGKTVFQEYDGVLLSTPTTRAEMFSGTPIDSSQKWPQVTRLIKQPKSMRLTHMQYILWLLEVYYPYQVSPYSTGFVGFNCRTWTIYALAMAKIWAKIPVYP